MRSLMRILAATLSGVLLVFIAPPLNLAWLQYFSFVPLLWALSVEPQDPRPPPRGWYGLRPLLWELREPGNRTNLALGLLFGFASEAAIYSWLLETVRIFSNLPTWLALIVLHIFSLAHGLPFVLIFGLVRPLRRHLGAGWLWILPALVVAVEWLCPALFPYQQGAPQYRQAWIFQLASITGVWGLTYLVMLVNCTVAEWLYRWREQRRPLPWRPTVAVALIFAVNLAFGAWRHGRVELELDEARLLRVSILQQSITMKERMEQGGKEAIRGWVELTKQVMGQDIDLVVWPEGASPFNVHEGSMKKLLAQIVAAGDFELLVGGGTLEIKQDHESGKKRFLHYNSVYLMDRKGEIAGRYDKMVPLPFGEYLPFADVFPELRQWIKGPGNFRAGYEPTIFEAQGYTIAAPICYEAILQKAARKLKTADLFVNVTNDAWFGDTGCPHQHAMLAAVRSTELGRPTLRMAYTGVSMIVELFFYFL